MLSAQLLNTAGLVLGMAGAAVLFFFGAPQPRLEPGVALELEDGTPLESSGKTVADFNREVEERRRVFSRRSKIGLALIFAGFALQLWAQWAP